MTSRNYGVIKIDQNGRILWMDHRASKLLHHRQGKNIERLDELVVLAGDVSVQEYLAKVLEAASYKNAEGAVMAHSFVTPEEEFQLSVWQSTENTQEILCHIASVHDDTISGHSTEENLLSVIQELQKDYIADKSAFYVFGRALKSLLSLTQSGYGFIGEILINPKGDRYLKTRAITNIAWNQETRDFYQKNAPSGMEFYNQKSLFGVTVRTGEVVITNAPASHPDSAGIPSGHPDLNAYMGLPIFSGDEFVGMAGLANRPEGFSAELAEQVAPLLNTLGMLITAYRNEQKRKRAEAELAMTAFELERANKAKSRFFAGMSHELRTPLNSILGFSKRLHKNLSESSNERNLNAMASVVRNAELLAEMIDDVLDLSKMEAGQMDFDKTQFTMHSVISDALISIQGMAEKQEVQITDRTPHNLQNVLVWADSRRMLQIALNLLSNAIKYGGRRVEITLEQTRPDEIAMVVSDHGPGIRQSAKDMLFQEYSQLASNAREGIQGTGLGLALVAQITQQMGGRNWVNTDVGVGSRFYAAFPTLEDNNWSI